MEVVNGPSLSGYRQPGPIHRQQRAGVPQGLSVAETRRDMIDTDLLRWLRGFASVVAVVVALPGCVNAYFQVPRSILDEHAYTALYPYFAEYCAVSEFNKKKGFGVDIEGGGPGGHSVFYLNGACRVHDAGYPELALCDAPPEGMAGRGVGLSVNAHYRNANWVATEGRDFFYGGDLAPGDGVNRATYDRTQGAAKAMGILDGIEFHRDVMAGKPASMSDRDFMYEISVATDYAIDLARDRYCARVPLDRGRMETVVRHLNALNQPYRSGQKDFNWQVLRNNCAYLAHNALSTIDLWPEWPTGRPLLIAAFNFPVPKNEFVNLMRRTNDMRIDDPDALFDDDAAHAALLGQGWIATQPGALAQASPAVRPNDIYDTKLRLIFYDEAIFGHYQRRFERIFAEPRYTDIASNLWYFSGLYATILATQHERDAPAGHAAFHERYYDAIARAKMKVDAGLARLSGIAG